MPANGDECKSTSFYVAPELLHPEKFGLGAHRISKQADIYAFGMIIYEVLTGRPPFGAEKNRHPKVMQRVMEGKRPRKPENAEDIGFGGGTWELTQQCWHHDRKKRPTAEKLSRHFQDVRTTSPTILPGPTTPASESDGYFRVFGRCLLHLTPNRSNLTSYNTHSPAILPCSSNGDKHRSVDQGCHGSYA